MTNGKKYLNRLHPEKYKMRSQNKSALTFADFSATIKWVSHVRTNQVFSGRSRPLTPIPCISIIYRACRIELRTIWFDYCIPSAVNRLPRAAGL